MGRLVALAVVGSLVVALCAGIVRDNVSGGAESTQATVDQEAAKAQAKEAYGKLPMSFEANAGQTDSAVNFTARGQGYNLFLTPSEAVLSLSKPMPRGGPAADAPAVPSPVIRMQLLGSNVNATPVQGQPLPGRSNYLIGQDRSQWRTDVPTYGDVAYQGVYPGIDLKYYGNQSQLEYDFIVSPGADPGAIRLNFAGAESLTLSPEGDLLIKSGDGEVRQHKPVVFQDLGGQRRPVAGDFALGADNQVGFQLGAYDPAAALVIDPAIAYSTYLGGFLNDFGFGIAVDGAGNAYLGGQTGTSTIFPRGGAGDPNPKGSTPGAPQPAFGGGPSDAYVLKLNPAGSAVIYSTFLGGSRSDMGFDLAIDAEGNAYLGGATDSADDPGTTAVESGFPTTNGSGGTVAAFDSTCGTDGKCNNVLPANYFVPACDPFAPACNPGNPESPGFLPAICPPTDPDGEGPLGGFPNGCATPQLSGPADNFLTKVNATGTALLYSTYYGGSGFEQSPEDVPYSGQGGVGVNGTKAYLTSMTFSSDFPTTPNAFQPACASCNQGNNDSYLTVLDTAVGGAASLTYSTYVGGSGFDEGKGVAVDAAGNAYLTGVITGVDSTPGGTTFPVKNPLGGRYLGSGLYNGGAYKGGYSDAYVTKINPSAANAADTLVWSTFLGGGGKEEGWSLALGGNPESPQVFVTGYTSSGKNPYPQVADPAHPGACAAPVDPNLGFRPFCDYATEPVPYFPITSGAYQTSYAGRASYDSGGSLYFDGDAFVLRLLPDGSRLAYSTFLGGPNADYGQSIAVDSRLNAHVVGWTTCRQMNNVATPANETPPQFEAGGAPTGRQPGDPAQTGVGDCPVGFPVVNAPAGLNTMNNFYLGFEAHNSPTGVFLTKLLPTGGGVAYSLLFDGRGFDRGFSVAVRDAPRGLSEAYITGRTGNAPDFPITPGSYDTTYNGAGRDAWITRVVG